MPAINDCPQCGCPLTNVIMDESRVPPGQALGAIYCLWCAFQGPWGFTYDAAVATWNAADSGGV